MKRLIVFAAIAASAQPLKFPASFEALEKKATESVDISLDKSMLGTASSFIANEVDVKKMLNNAEAVYVRSFQFAKPGEYQMSDVIALRNQLDMTKWKRVMSVKEDDEMVEIYMMPSGAGPGGFVMFAAEPEELTIVQIVGSVNLNDLSKLQGLPGVKKTKPLKKLEKREE